MARMQVYVPDELHAQIKAHGLKASEIFQEAVAAKLRRLQLEQAAQEYIDGLIAEVGEPTARDLAYADQIVGQILDHQAGQSAPSVKAS